MNQDLDMAKVESYLATKIQYRRRGDKAEAVFCPFCTGGDHGDKRTFIVFLDEDGGNYSCRRGSCGVAGDFKSLVLHFGDDPQDFYRPNTSKRLLGPSKPQERPIEKPVERQIKNPKYSSEQFTLHAFTDEAYDYLALRGFSDTTLDNNPIGCDEKGNIALLYEFDQKVCLVKIRPPRKAVQGTSKAWQAWKGGLRVLWGRERLDFAHPEIVITMGEFDALAVRQAGIKNVVSIPCGDEDFEWVALCWDELQKFKRIVVWPDNDVSGEKCLNTIADRLGRERVKVVRVEHKDANDMLYAVKKSTDCDERALATAVRDAEWYHKDDLIQVVDIEAPERDFDGYLTGFKFLDAALHGFLKGQLTVHVGDSKSGKSTAITHFTANCIQQGARVCVWSGEDEKDDYRYRTDVHIAGHLGVDMLTSKAGREYARVKEEYKPLIRTFLKDHLYLYDRRINITEDHLLQTFNLAYQRYGCDVFVVDNLMKMVAAKDTNHINSRQTRIINALSDFAKDKKVHVHIAAHTNKSDDPFKPPTKNGISGAKEISNLADIVLAWWRVPEALVPEYDHCTSHCGVLANRVFGDEPGRALRYDWRVKRFGQEDGDLTKIYVGPDYGD